MDLCTNLVALRCVPFKSSTVTRGDPDGKSVYVTVFNAGVMDSGAVLVVDPATVPAGVTVTIGGPNKFGVREINVRADNAAGVANGVAIRVYVDGDTAAQAVVTVNIH
jgi:hypothetical protein